MLNIEGFEDSCLVIAGVGGWSTGFRLLQSRLKPGLQPRCWVRQGASRASDVLHSRFGKPPRNHRNTPTSNTPGTTNTTASIAANPGIWL